MTSGEEDEACGPVEVKRVASVGVGVGIVEGGVGFVWWVGRKVVVMMMVVVVGREEGG